MPKNIFNFSSKYLTNTLATHKYLIKLSIGKSSACSFCHQSETLQHMVSSCKSYLDQGRYTWRHDLAPKFIANTPSALPSCSLHANLPAFLSPFLVIIGDYLRPDHLLITENKTLYILELIIEFETNIKVNSNRKALKYSLLHHALRSTNSQINFINLSLDALGTVGSSSDSFSELLKAVDVDSKMQKATLSRTMNITISCT